MTQSDNNQQNNGEGDNEVSATWLKDQFGLFGTKLQGLEEQFKGLMERLPKQSEESQSRQTTPQQPTPDRAQVQQPTESQGTQKPKGPRSVLRIGTGLTVRK